MTTHRLIVAALLTAAACSNPRQIVLSIDTTAGIPCDIDRLRVRATGSEMTTFEQDVTNERLPFTLRLSDETSTGQFQLEVSGLKGETEVLRATGPLAFGPEGTDFGTRIVLDENCTVETPCSLPELQPYNGPPAPVTSRFLCGQAVTRYMHSPATETFSDVCNTPGDNAGKVLIDGSVGAAKLPLAEAVMANFDFRFYGRPVRQVWAHEDGYVSFSRNNPDPENDLDAGGFDRDLIGDGVPPPVQSAMVFWDTLTLSSNGVCYALEGNPGTQKLRVTWRMTCDISPCGSDNLNFTIVLDERNQRISFTYGDMVSPSNPQRALGSSATIGVVNKADGCAATQCTNGLCSDNTTPCGYTQVTSNTAQPPRLPNYQLDPM